MSKKKRANGGEDDSTKLKADKSIPATSQDRKQSNALRICVKALTWVFRIITGATYIFSGFVKAVDPWGSYYKFEEYMAAMGLPSYPSLLITGVFALCAFEFILGICLLLGCYRKSAPILSLLFMCVMLPLTLWIAMKNPVSDCGCFGEYLLLTNWETFFKNVLLTAMAIWLVRFNMTCITIISPAFQWIGVVISLVFILTLSFIGYFTQPLLDFRPYTYGTSLLEEDGDDASNFVFVYEKDGKRQEFGVDDELPSEDDGWTFVERKATGTSHKATEKRTLRLWSRDGDSDMTEEVLSDEGVQVLVLMPKMADVSPATTWKINALYNWAENQDGDMLAVTDGTTDQIERWEDSALPEYEIYTADDTAIKEVARGNPAVVLLKDGKIEWKSTLSALDVDKMEKEGADFRPSGLVANPVENMEDLVLFYIICMAVPVALSFMPRLKNLFGKVMVRRKRESPSDDSDSDDSASDNAASDDSASDDSASEE